jgi:hypothetical protein
LIVCCFCPKFARFAKEVFPEIGMVGIMEETENEVCGKVNVYNLKDNKITCASGSDMEIIVVSTVKHFLSIYLHQLIGKVDVVLVVIPMEKSFAFPTAVSSAMTWSYTSIFMFWEVR